MDAREIIQTIRDAKKKTPARLYYKAKGPVEFENCRDYGSVIFGNLEEIEKGLEQNKDILEYYDLEIPARNSALPLADYSKYNARIEPGAIIRDQVEIEDNAVIMMGAVLNIGAVVGQNSMIDMNAVLGGRATVGKNCHIGAGAVLAGVIEPASAQPVIIEDNVLVGANAVVLEGVRVGKDAVIAAGAVVTEDIPEGAVAAGSPAKVIKYKDEKTASKTGLEQDLRKL